MSNKFLCLIVLMCTTRLLDADTYKNEVVMKPHNLNLFGLNIDPGIELSESITENMLIQKAYLARALEKWKRENCGEGRTERNKLCIALDRIKKRKNKA